MTDLVQLTRLALKVACIKSGSVSPPFHRSLGLSCTCRQRAPFLLPLHKINIRLHGYAEGVSLFAAYSSESKSFLDLIGFVQLHSPTSIYMLIHTLTYSSEDID